MNKIKKRFTKWYVNKGYLFEYDFTVNPTESSFVCPIWVRPFLIFFSPSVYLNETYGKIVHDGIREGDQGWRRSSCHRRRIRRSAWG